jgi:hypothetical protein
MKLEMTVHGLNVNLELDDAYNALEVLQHVKNLIDELSAYDTVMLSIVSAPDDEDFESSEEHEDFEDYEEVSEQVHIARATWPFPEGGLDDQGAEVIAFAEPEHRTA